MPPLVLLVWPAQAAVLQGTSITLDTREAPTTATVELLRVPGDLHTDVRVAALLLGGVPRDGIEVATKLSAEGLSLTLPVAEMSPGSWEVRLQFSGNDLETVTEDVTVTVPEPLVELQTTSPWIQRTADDAPTFEVVLRETSGRAGVYLRDLAWEGGRRATGTVVDGLSVHCTPRGGEEGAANLYTLRAGSSAVFHCATDPAPGIPDYWDPSLGDNGWIGEVDGTIAGSMNASTPVRSDLTLSRRAGRFWLFWPILVGLFVSWIVQNRVTGRLTALQAVKQSAVRLRNLRQTATSTSNTALRDAIEAGMTGRPKAAYAGEDEPKDLPHLTLAILTARWLEDAASDGGWWPPGAPAQHAERLAQLLDAISKAVATLETKAEDGKTRAEAASYVRDLSLRHIARTIARLEASASVFTLLLVFVIALAAWWTRWTGSASDMLQVFTWALSLRVTAGLAFELVQGRQLPTG